MNAQESRSLQDFLALLVQAQGTVKDPQADQLIRDAVARQPDAAYLLVQRAMLLDAAMTQAKAQIDTLQTALRAATPAAPADAGGFLNPANAWGNSAAAARPLPPVGAPAPYAAAAPVASPAFGSYGSAPVAPVAASPGFFGNGMGSMFGTMAATAAGVAGGAFLYQGLENMWHSHQQPPTHDRSGQNGLLDAESSSSAGSAQNAFSDMQPDAGGADTAASFDSGGFDGGDSAA